MAMVFLRIFLLAFLTNALHDVVNVLNLKPFRKLYRRYMLRLQTESTVAYGTESVHMVTMMVITVSVVLHTEAVFAVSAAVFEPVKQVVFFKKGECTENTATVHRRQQVLYIGQ